MRSVPTAFGWIDHDVTTTPEWDAAQVRRLARLLGYTLLWPSGLSALPLPDQVRAAETDAVITPTPLHLDVLTLHTLMYFVDVETVCPRMSFARWATTSPPRTIG
ncbi:hypothetical protein [Nocardia blacklockiae]|uniref:hypothetical protein n=1 Tax=Nocardia blacklockiae TaxID=480036 RepID=UPI0018959108|nr:hypothetical protein [Nocardia blacklockiae]MBF6174178.1 hypothetical protein [Nocardia blacklockiae]